MATDPVHELIASIRSRVEAELDAHAPALAARYAATITDVRKQADAEADRRWAALLDTHKTQARQELQAAVAAALLESQSGRVLLDAFRGIDSAGSVSAVLSLISKAAGRQSTRARVYVGAELEPWGDVAEAATPAALLASLRQAANTAAPVRHELKGVAVPIMLDGTAVAVVYAETDTVTQGWTETIELLARYGGAHLGYVTALRTAHAQGWIAAAGPTVDLPAASQPVGAPAPGPDEDSAQSARRYAKLLVSEIKLYNEAAVREGSEARDLARRLGPEIERARRLYEERVPSSVPDRAEHFHHELVQTLAGGNPALLG